MAVREAELLSPSGALDSKGWCRELWIKSLGMHAVLPPLEEERHVKTAIGAARAERAADAQR